LLNTYHTYVGAFKLPPFYFVHLQMEFVQFHFQLLTSIGWRLEVPQISSLSEAIVTPLGHMT